MSLRRFATKIGELSHKGLKIKIGRLMFHFDQIAINGKIGSFVRSYNGTADFSDAFWATIDPWAASGRLKNCIFLTENVTDKSAKISL